MILLRTIAIGTGSSSNMILNCNLVRIGVSHHPENLEHPDKKLNSLGIILISEKTLSLWKNISLPPPKNPNLQEKHYSL